MQKKALLITDDTALGSFDSAIKDRLENFCGYKVTEKAADNFSKRDTAAVDVIVLCTSRTPCDIRTLPIPVVVCHQGALYDLGMTLATPDTDFGVESGNASVNIRSGGNPFGLGISGLQSVIQIGQGLGWGRPGSEAFVTAVLPGSVDRAVLFGYDLNSKMPALSAAHRRVAVLLGSLQSNSLTQSGWALFEAGLTWATFGGTISHPAAKDQSSVWFIEGKPTKILSIDEYRNWVHENIMTKLVAILVGVGVIGLVGLWTINTNRIDTEVKKEVDTQKEVLNEQTKANYAQTKVDILTQLQQIQANLETSMDKRADAIVLKTVVENSALNEQLDIAVSKAITADEPRITSLAEEAVDKKATRELIESRVQTAVNSNLTPALLQEKVDRSLNDTNNRSALASIVAKKFADQRYFENLITAEMIPVITNSSLQQEESQREQALRFLLLFGTDPELLRSTLLGILTNTADNDYDELGPIALRAYSPTRDAGQNRLDLATVLGQLDKVESARAELRGGYTRFISRFEAHNANQVTGWIKQSRNTEGQRIAVDGLAYMDGDEPVSELVELTLDLSPLNQELGWRGLSQLEPSRQISEEKRLECISKLWRSISSSMDGGLQQNPRVNVKQSTANLIQSVDEIDTSEIRTVSRSGPADSADRLYGNFNRNSDELFSDEDTSPQNLRLSRLRFANNAMTSTSYGRSCSIFARLIRTNDWSALTNAPFWPSDCASGVGKLKAEGLILAMSVRLNYEHLSDAEIAGFEKYLVDIITQQTNCLYRSSLCEMLLAALSRCSYESRSNVLSKAVELACDTPDQGSALDFTGHDAIVEAVNRDSGSPGPLFATKQMVTNAINKLATLVGIPPGQPLVDTNSATREWCRRANQASAIGALLQSVTNLEVLETVFEPSLPQLNKANLEFAYKVGRSSVATIYESNARSVDRSFSIDRNADDEKLSRALTLYKKAIQFGSTNYNRAVSLLADRAFKHLDVNEDDQAVVDFSAAADLIPNQKGEEKEKADKLEDIGLVYVRQQNWNAAIDNSEKVLKLNKRQTWNALFRYIATDQLHDTNKLSESRELLENANTGLFERTLREYLPSDLRHYIDEAIDMRRNSQ